MTGSDRRGFRPGQAQGRDTGWIGGPDHRTQREGDLSGQLDRAEKARSKAESSAEDAGRAAERDALRARYEALVQKECATRRAVHETDSQSARDHRCLVLAGCVNDAARPGGVRPAARPGRIRDERPAVTAARQRAAELSQDGGEGLAPHWDRRDLLDTMSVIAQALSTDENIRVSSGMTEAEMNAAVLT